MRDIAGSAYPAGRDDVADMARTLSGGETPVELITRLGLDHLRRLFGAGHPFALSE